MSSEIHIGEAVPLPGAPRWALSGLYAALATAAICWPAWPGMMSYDSLFAYREAREGVTTMLWPPAHAYLFWLSQHLGANGWGLFLGQTFLLFGSAAVIINLLVRSRLWSAAGLGAFALGFVYVPELWGAAMVQWRDVTTASFTLAGLALWLLAAHSRMRTLLVAAALSFGLAAALRYNALLLIVFVAALMAWRPFLGATAPKAARPLTAAMLGLALLLAWSSTHWRLPDLRALPQPDNFAGTQQFDLIGISACADKTYLPPAMTAGWPIAPKQIRMAYDPRHLQLAFRPIPGAPRIVETTAGGELQKIWPVAVRAEFGCYLKHRAAVFVEQMGMARQAVFYPTELRIVPNPYGLAPAHPSALRKADAYVYTRADELWRRPFWLYLLAPIAVALLWIGRRPGRELSLALLGGALLYPAFLFIAGPAADARYIFPSSVVCLLILAAGGAVFMDGRRQSET